MIFNLTGILSGNWGIDKKLPFPYVAVRDGRIITGNQSLNLEKGELLTECMGNYDEELARQKVFFNDKNYLLFSSKCGFRENTTIIYFIELPEEAAEKVIVGIIFIDSYDEAIDTVEEARRPMLTASVDQLITDMAYKSGGIVTKFESDKYIFILAHNKLEYLKEKKFDVLDRTREIEMGNSIPVTLSMGIGVNGNTISQCLEYARAALNLALGRGGDQVVVKDGEAYLFYGGSSTEIGQNTRVRARVKAYVLSELIAEAENVMVIGHKNPDFDCLGAAVGIEKIVTSMGKSCSIIINELPASLKTLYGKLNDDRGGKLFLTSDEATRNVKPGSLLIVVDTHRPSLLEDKALLTLFKKIVVFDHHRKNAESIQNTVMSYHEPYASSTSELVTEMLSYVKTKIKLTPLEADALLCGITVDTKWFSVKTGAKTFDAAAYLRRNGGDPSRIRKYFKNDLESYKARSGAVAGAEILFDGVAVSICPSNIANPLIITAQAADELLNISGVYASFVLCETKDIIYISARSSGKINVQVIMEKLGGGGHQTVAGAQLHDCNISNAVNLTKDALDKYFKEVKK